MDRPRILIISSGNPCRNPRPVKEASALASAGFDVTLLTGGIPALAATDRESLAGIPCHFIFEPESRSLAARVQRWLARRANRLGFETIQSIGDPKPLLRRARKIPAELVIVHNEVPHAAGVALLKAGRAVAADFEDWHSEDLLPEDRKHRPLRRLRSQERFLLRHARYCTTTSRALANELHSNFGGKLPEVISNAFPLQRLSGRPSNVPPKFFWFSQTIGPGRGLEAFLAAWQQTKNPSSLTLLGEISAGYQEALLDSLPGEFAGRVQFLPLVAPAVLPEVIARHDIGLALEDRTIRNRDLTITNKILQYLNAGLAVVASDTAGQREVLASNPEAGVVVQSESPAEYTRTLDDLLASPEKLGAKKLAARRLAEEKYCWEREASRLVARVKLAIGSPQT